MIKKILVIDDEKNSIEGITKTLTEEGFKVLTEFDGIKGIQTARTKMPDIILCDIQMPAPDGYEVLQIVRECDALYGTPFILMTDGNEISEFRTGMARGADDCITKSSNRQELLNAINSRLLCEDRKRRHCQTRLDELRDSIAYSMPHEFFTPLSVILGNTELLNNYFDTFDRNEVMDVISDITKSALRLNKLSENMLFYTRLELLRTRGDTCNKGIASFGSVRAKEFIEKLAADLGRDYMRASDIKLRLDDALIRISEEYLCKALTEIINNAVKFSEKGSNIEISAAVIKNSYVIKIKDRGRGMTGEQLTRLGACLQFDRKCHEQQGFGLGLAIARKIAEMFCGELNVESEYGISTTVIFTIPCAGERMSEKPKTIISKTIISLTNEQR
jgi:K+-sensing histidine kinase KdpD